MPNWTTEHGNFIKTRTLRRHLATFLHGGHAFVILENATPRAILVPLTECLSTSPGKARTAIASTKRDFLNTLREATQ